MTSVQICVRRLGVGGERPSKRATAQQTSLSSEPFTGVMVASSLIGCKVTFLCLPVTLGQCVFPITTPQARPSQAELAAGRNDGRRRVKKMLGSPSVTGPLLSPLCLASLWSVLSGPPLWVISLSSHCVLVQTDTWEVPTREHWGASRPACAPALLEVMFPVGDQRKEGVDESSLQRRADDMEAVTWTEDVAEGGAGRASAVVYGLPPGPGWVRVRISEPRAPQPVHGR